MSQRAWVGVVFLVAVVALPLVGQMGQPSGGTKKAGASDHTLVERLLNARKEYQETLEALRAYYIAVGDLERARWAEDELLLYHRIPKQAYRLEQVVPPANLKAEHNIPEANNLLRQAKEFKDKGWGQDYADNLKRAELLLETLLIKYPQSDKISDAAYMLGEIYESRTYRQFGRAALFFQRCYQWNPKTQSDARLRAARLYEKALNERVTAIEIYREVTTHESDPKRVDEAQRKLTELSGGK